MAAQETPTDIAPTGDAEFHKKEYWDTFFTKRKEAFEWYISYADMKPTLKPLLKSEDKILMIGCGNSTLSGDLYDDSYRHIVNIDISTVALESMKQQNVGRTEMTWEQMDFLDMKFSDESFDVVIDKGGLDALISDQKSESEADKLFKEIKRVLKEGGKYVCVTLAEEHILRKILSSFEGTKWTLDLFHLQHVQEKSTSPLPTFLVVLNKLKETTSAETLPVNLHFSSHVDWTEEEKKQQEDKKKSGNFDWAVSEVKAVQLLHSRKTNLRTFQEGRIVSLPLFDERVSKTVPRFNINVCDIPEKGEIKGNCAVFIVPQGRESEWLFSSEDGIKSLADSLNYRRLIVVSTNREHTYISVDALKILLTKSELSPQMVELAPNMDPFGAFEKREVEKIPFITIGEGLGTRIQVAQHSSKLSGDMIIEDVKVNKQFFRRLTFLNQQNLVQSEARMKEDRATLTKKIKKGKAPPVKSSSIMSTPSEEPSLIPDHSYLCNEYHRAMIAGLSLISPKKGEHIDTLIIGLGGGSLSTFLAHHFNEIRQEVVEIDETIATVAKDYFGFQPSNQVSLTIGDGIKHVQNLSDAITASEKQPGAAKKKPQPKQKKSKQGDDFAFLDEELKKTDKRKKVIILDVDSKERGAAISCPPPAFLEPSFIRQLAACLLPSGVVMLNIVTRDDKAWDEVVAKVSQVFPYLYKLKMKEDVNRILFCMLEKSHSLHSWDLLTKIQAHLWDEKDMTIQEWVAEVEAIPAPETQSATSQSAQPQPESTAQQPAQAQPAQAQPAQAQPAQAQPATQKPAGKKKANKGKK